MGLGGNRVVQAKEDIRHLINVSRFAKSAVLIAHQLYIYTECILGPSRLFTLDFRSMSNIHVIKIAITVDDQN